MIHGALRPTWATLVAVSPAVVQPLPTDVSAEPDITPEDGNDSISIEEGEHIQTFEGSEGLDVPPVFSVQEQANLKELTLLN